MREQLISFETAKLAKKKGFDDKCLACFNKSGELKCANLTDLDDVYNVCFPLTNTDIDEATNHEWRFKDGFTAPTQSLLQKWLRDEHDLHFGARITRRPKTSGLKDYFRSTKDDFSLFIGRFNTYEEALEEALKEALKLIP